MWLSLENGYLFCLLNYQSFKNICRKREALEVDWQREQNLSWLNKSRLRFTTAARQSNRKVTNLAPVKGRHDMSRLWCYFVKIFNTRVYTKLISFSRSNVLKLNGSHTQLSNYTVPLSYSVHSLSHNHVLCVLMILLLLLS